MVLAFLRRSSSRAIRPGLDGLAEAGVVGDEEVDARQTERLAQRLHLVGVDLDAGAERRLEEVRIGGRDAVPAQRVEEGRELARSVEALGGEVLPTLFLEDPAVELVVPEHVEGLALGVVVRARLRRASVASEPAQVRRLPVGARESVELLLLPSMNVVRVDGN